VRSSHQFRVATLSCTHVMRVLVSLLSCPSLCSIYKMPATATEAATTSLMGFFQKRKFKNFLNWVFNYDFEKPGDFDVNTKTMAALYDKFGLDGNTQDFVGHAMALYTDDDYIQQPAVATVKRIRLYGFSMQRYGKSPFIYPIWGIGGMPEGFSRYVTAASTHGVVGVRMFLTGSCRSKCAINGGTFILNKNVDEILFDNSGRAVGVRCGETVSGAVQCAGSNAFRCGGGVDDGATIAVARLRRPLSSLVSPRTSQRRRCARPALWCAACASWTTPSVVSATHAPRSSSFQAPKPAAATMCTCPSCRPTTRLSARGVCWPSRARR